MIIKNAQVYTEGFAFEKRDVAVEGELFAETAGVRSTRRGCSCFPG